MFTFKIMQKTEFDKSEYDDDNWRWQQDDSDYDNKIDGNIL